MRFHFATASIVLAVVAAAPSASARREVGDYRYFRALSIDLQGRIPSRDEVAEFEKDSFDLERWIDDHLQGPAYAERVRRVYMDLMRLDVGRSFQINPVSTTLRREQVLGPDGKQIYVYFRGNQRRTREETDGAFCLTQAETGLQFQRTGAPLGTPIPVSNAALDANTVVVKPWWLYRDYKTDDKPKDRYSPDGWKTIFPGFTPVAGLLVEPNGTPTTEVRVCKEEASIATTGTVFVTNRPAPKKGEPPPYGRVTPLPLDNAYAKTHKGEAISCASGTGYQYSTECGCGVGLELCMPGNSNSNDPQAMVVPGHVPLGFDAALDTAADQQASWLRFWWSQEARHFIDAVVAEDRDFREVLNGRYSFVNGPLTQFYRAVAPATCCGNGAYMGYTEPEPLFATTALPELAPHDTDTWKRVDDRGPHAAGVLTMPVFLTKFGSRRGRAHVLYNAFLCRDFVAPNVQLTPSKEPNLMIRSGCATCHVSLEPLAAFFTRVAESDWTWLPSAQFPLDAPSCRSADPKKIPGYCKGYYDPAFTDGARALLRGAYGSNEHAEAGPAGIADYLAKAEEFPTCVAQNLGASFLGRRFSTDDAVLQKSLVDAFTGGGFKIRGLIRTLVHADAYKRANNLSSTAWRDQGGAK